MCWHRLRWWWSRGEPHSQQPSAARSSTPVSIGGPAKRSRFWLGLIVDAADLAEAEALRGYDAVHLAAAVTVGATVFTSADSELCAAAQRRGLHIANPLSE